MTIVLICSECLALEVMFLLLLLLCIAIQICIYTPIAKTVAHVIIPKSAWKMTFFFLISFFYSRWVGNSIPTKISFMIVTEIIDDLLFAINVLSNCDIYW